MQYRCNILFGEFGGFLLIECILCAFGLQYKRGRLQGIQQGFDEQEHRAIKTELEKAKKQILSLQKELTAEQKAEEGLRAAAQKSSEESLAARNRLAKLQSRLEKQEAENEALRARIRELEKKQAAPAPEPETVSEPASEETSESAPDYSVLLAGIFAEKRVVFVGGDHNIMGKFERKYPDAVVLPRDSATISETLVARSDAVLFKTDSLSHKEYNQAKAIAERNGVPVGYIGNYANLGKMEADVYKELSRLGLASETFEQ